MYGDLGLASARSAARGATLASLEWLFEYGSDDDIARTSARSAPRPEPSSSVPSPRRRNDSTMRHEPRPRRGREAYRFASLRSRGDGQRLSRPSASVLTRKSTFRRERDVPKNALRTSSSDQAPAGRVFDAFVAGLFAVQLVTLPYRAAQREARSGASSSGPSGGSRYSTRSGPQRRGSRRRGPDTAAPHRHPLPPLTARSAGASRRTATRRRAAPRICAARGAGQRRRPRATTIRARPACAGRSISEVSWAGTDFRAWASTSGTTLIRTSRSIRGRACR